MPDRRLQAPNARVYKPMSRRVVTLAKGTSISFSGIYPKPPCH